MPPLITTIFSVRGSVPSVWTTVKTTSVPLSPLIALTALAIDQPSVGTPSTSMIKSPARIPARSAGESRKGTPI